MSGIMKGEFLIGCNYWASNAGTEMWRDFDENAIRDDLRILSENGVRYMRVFPNWRDFQPVMPVYIQGAVFSEYMLEGDVLPANRYYLDEKMLDRFARFCELCEKSGIKLVVGILTGWMSGRLFIPSALFGKDIFTDPEALMLEGLFVKGFVKAMKNQKAIYAWDLGNECNCMGKAQSRFTAAAWTAFVANAIKAEDASRPLFSGMHGIGAADTGRVWTINDQSEYCDVLTTHPYPPFVDDVFLDEFVSFRTTMHASCETKFYSDLGGKPCMIEEIGNLGRMMCSDENAAKFARLNLFSGWANGSTGMMWWCANEQTYLRTNPYTRYMCENELGMISAERRPKPVLDEFRKFSGFIDRLDFDLPKAHEDAVCVLTKGQNQWGVAFMSYSLAKQAGMNLRFAFISDEIPPAEAYLLPSISSAQALPLEGFEVIKNRVKNGAKLYISIDDAMITGLEELCGVRVSMAEKAQESGEILLDGSAIPYRRSMIYHLDVTRATVLARDERGEPAIVAAQYGNGMVYFVNFPLEKTMIDENDAFNRNRHKIYAQIFAQEIGSHAVITENPLLALTLHYDGETAYCVIVNHSDKAQPAGLIVRDGYAVSDVLYGDPEAVGGYDAAVIRLRKVRA